MSRPSYRSENAFYILMKLVRGPVFLFILIRVLAASVFGLGDEMSCSPAFYPPISTVENDFSTGLVAAAGSSFSTAISC